MTFEMTALRENLETAINNATSAHTRVETLNTAVGAMQTALSSLKAEHRTARFAELRARNEARNAEECLHVAEANELAANWPVDKAHLTLWICDALRTSVSGLAEAVVAKLEYAQRFGGLREEGLESVGVNHTTKTGRTVWRGLAREQRRRVWQALTLNCPPRDEGVLGTPYVLELPH